MMTMANTIQDKLIQHFYGNLIEEIGNETKNLSLDKRIAAIREEVESRISEEELSYFMEFYPDKQPIRIIENVSIHTSLVLFFFGETIEKLIKLYFLPSDEDSEKVIDEMNENAVEKQYLAPAKEMQAFVSEKVEDIIKEQALIHVSDGFVSQYVHQTFEDIDYVWIIKQVQQHMYHASPKRDIPSANGYVYELIQWTLNRINYKEIIS